MWIYLSPHLDDAAFSCGGLLWTQTQGGEEVSVWTLFAGDPPAGELSPFARHMHERWGMASSSFDGRRAEDRRACAMLGAEWHHHLYRDCIYRQAEPGGAFLYPTHRHIFGRPSRADRGLVDKLVGELAERLPAPARVLAPLGLGNHVDHRLTRLAAEQLERPLWYYEDFPYVVGESNRLLRLRDAGWDSEVIAVDEAGLEAWQAAVAAYASQLNLFWDSGADMRAAVRQHCAGIGGVRLWRRSNP